MIRRDVNAPCIIAWDNGNEGGRNQDWGGGNAGNTNYFPLYEKLKEQTVTLANPGVGCGGEACLHFFMQADVPPVGVGNKSARQLTKGRADCGG